MDTFDVAFLLLTEKAYSVPFKKCKGIVLKSERDVQMWGPEARLMADILVGAWKRKSKKFLAELQDCFIIEPKVKIDTNRIEKLFRQNRNIGEEVWKVVEKKVTSLLDTTVERSLDYFKKQRKNSKKTSKAEDEKELDYEVIISEAIREQIKNFVEQYPEKILHKEILRLSQYIIATDETGKLDKDDIYRRINMIADKGIDYFQGMADVEVGNAWTSTGLKLAQESGVTEYIIVAQIDDPNKPCPVCLTMHGKTFSVEKAIEKVDHLMSLNGTEDFAKEHPFPRLQDIDNLSREEFKERGDFPSFHNMCRCDIVMNWASSTSIPQFPEKKVSTRSVRGHEKTLHGIQNQVDYIIKDYALAGKTITIEEGSKIRDALSAYSSTDYDNIMAALKGKEFYINTYGTDKYYKEYKEYGRLIQEYINVAPVYPASKEMYRGLGKSARSMYEAMTVGDIFNSESFVSFSTSKRVSEKFTEEGGVSITVLKSTTKQKKGRNGISLRALSIHPGENEVLMSKNAQFRIVSALYNEITKIFEVVCEEVL